MSDIQTDPKTAKPFYKRWWFIALAVIFVLIIANAAIGGGDDSDSSSTDGTSSSDTSSVEETEEEATEEEPVEEETSAGFYEEEYGTFTVVEESGTGDAVVRLPAGALYAVVTATHSGSSNFSIQSLDAANGLSELLVNEIGTYSGVSALGFSSFGDSADKLQITANGDWMVIIAPVASAPELPASGTGDGVYLYNGPAPIWQITHSGSSNFSVVEKSASSLFGLLVNEIGTYDGSVTGVAGPSVIIISADGDWTFTAQ